jgi:hypothetical protein
MNDLYWGGSEFKTPPIERLYLQRICANFFGVSGALGCGLEHRGIIPIFGSDKDTSLGKPSIIIFIVVQCILIL